MFYQIMLPAILALFVIYIVVRNFLEVHEEEKQHLTDEVKKRESLLQYEQELNSLMENRQLALLTVVRTTVTFLNRKKREFKSSDVYDVLVEQVHIRMNQFIWKYNLRNETERSNLV